MAPGGRKDTLVKFQNRWNQRKVGNMDATLIKDILHASEMQDKKRQTFLGLIEMYVKHLPEWNRLNRLPCLSKEKTGNRIQSVYRHTSGKFTSLKEMSDGLIQRMSNLRISGLSGDTATVFLSCSLNIEKIQKHVHYLLHEYERHPLQSTMQEISNNRATITTELERFRKLQACLMPDVGDRVTLDDAAFVESQALVLPSALNVDERTRWSIDALTEIEADLREGAIHDEQGNILTAAALVSMGRHAQRKQVSGQDGNTRAQRVIQRNEGILNEAIARYNGHRKALICLREYKDPEKQCRYKEVRLEDVYRKNMMEKRVLGDSHCNEGSVYHGSETPSATPARASSTLTSVLEGTVGTATTKKQKAARQNVKGALSNASGSTSPRGESPSVLNEKTNDEEIFINRDALHLHVDIEEWETEVNRVQCFRAEADFMNWRDECEKKVAELTRHIRSCKTMAVCWAELAQQSFRPGAIAYARLTSTTWTALEQRARSRLINDVPIPFYIDGGVRTGKRYLVGGARPLWEVFVEERRLEAKAFGGLPVTMKFGKASYIDEH
ncbi:hypothetical protein FISHEDRAFT_78674 [Fistulina hepatica ATCC 64428]|uniref:Uncharacterized protein n=1 Tax=Fistulina hepatica ATCC 64428 TaxID=1128425 RepID=A0A0D6ZZJ8_9AGAR|nr:hypothetical protein FISHEDRAFT_78674 [Fistulina hepatica ATCC 64428]